MISALTSLLTSLRLRNERRAAVRALAALNDHQLADIGIERGYILEAVNGDVPQRLRHAVQAR